MNEGFDLPPAPTPTPPLTSEPPVQNPNTQKALTLKEDGSIVSSDFYIRNENEPCFLGSNRRGSTPVSGASSRDGYKRKQAGCLSDANILEIMESDVSRFETFDAALRQHAPASCRYPQFREPLMEMPEKRWKVKNSKTQSPVVGENVVGKKTLAAGKNVGRWAYGDEHTTYSEILSDINDVKGVMMKRESDMNQQKSTLRRPSSSPPTLSKREIRVWEDRGGSKGIRQRNVDDGTTKLKKTSSKKKMSEQCEKSRSTSELERLKHATSDIIQRIERSQSRGKTKRPSSPRVAESKSLYDYRTLII